MNDKDVALFRQAEQLAKSGQTLIAHRIFSNLRGRGNTEIEILFWIVETTPNALEAQQTIDLIKYLQPDHPLVSRLDSFHLHKLQRGYTPITPVLLCPYCSTRAPAIIRNKTATAGWIIFIVLLILCFPLCWIGFFFYEPYYVCSYCGSRIATTG